MICFDVTTIHVEAVALITRVAVNQNDEVIYGAEKIV